MGKTNEPISVERLRIEHSKRQDFIRERLDQFSEIWSSGDDDRIWEEMVFCFFTGGCSARMGLRSVDAIRPILRTGTEQELSEALTGVHRYPNARSRYVVHSRNFFEESHSFQIKARLASFTCGIEKRDWLVKEKGIKGLGYKEASHFLRNIGFRGYAILDKHVLNCLYELNIICDPKPPSTRLRYLNIEEKLRQFSDDTGIDFDEMDLLLWSMKTGEILK